MQINTVAPRSAPGWVVFGGEVLAHMHERQYVYSVLLIVNRVNHTLTLNDEFADIFGISLGDLPANAGNVGQLDDRF